MVRKLFGLVKVATLFGMVAVAVKSLQKPKQGAEAPTPASVDTWPEVPRRP